MDLLLVTFLLIFWPLQSYQRTCYTGGHYYKVDCNTCWCLGAGTPVCSKIICSKIPNNFRKLLISSVANNRQRGNVIRSNNHCVRIIQASRRDLNSDQSDFRIMD